MYTPAAALAWEFWGRHRWGLAGVAELVAGFAVEPRPRNLAAVNSLWFGLGLCYVVGVFAYMLEGRLVAAGSGFPARLFVLPVRTGVRGRSSRCCCGSPGTGSSCGRAGSRRRGGGGEVGGGGVGGIDPSPPRRVDGRGHGRGAGPRAVTVAALTGLLAWLLPAGTVPLY